MIRYGTIRGVETSAYPRDGSGCQFFEEYSVPNNRRRAALRREPLSQAKTIYATSGDTQTCKEAF